MSGGIIDFFTGRGWTPIQAAGIAGNYGGESGFNHYAVGDGGAAFGLAQWHPDRQATFKRVIGVDIRQSTPQQQWAFTDWELRNTEKRAGQILGQQTTLSGATFAVMKHYERPADNSSFSKRLKAAGDVLAGGKSLLDKGKALLGIDVSDAANLIIPGSGFAMDALGIGGESCGIICQFQNWIKDSGFFQRLALAVLAFIVLAGALYLMKSNAIEGLTSRAKGVLK